MGYLVAYASVRHGYVASVVMARDADAARQLAIEQWGEPTEGIMPTVQQLSGLPLVYRDAERDRIATTTVAIVGG